MLPFLGSPSKFIGPLNKDYKIIKIKAVDLNLEIIKYKLEREMCMSRMVWTRLDDFHVMGTHN